MKFNYIYNELSMVNKEKIGKIFFDIFLSNNLFGNKNEVGRQAHSCVFY